MFRVSCHFNCSVVCWEQLTGRRSIVLSNGHRLKRWEIFLFPLQQQYVLQQRNRWRPGRLPLALLRTAVQQPPLDLARLTFDWLSCWWECFAHWFIVDPPTNAPTSPRRLGLNNSPTLEPHAFGNSTIMAMRYNTPTTPTSPLTRTRLPPYASTYGDFGSASGWSNVSSPTFDATGSSILFRCFRLSLRVFWAHRSGTRVRIPANPTFFFFFSVIN